MSVHLKLRTTSHVASLSTREWEKAAKTTEGDTTMEQQQKEIDYEMQLKEGRKNPLLSDPLFIWWFKPV